MEITHIIPGLRPTGASLAADGLPASKHRASVSGVSTDAASTAEVIPVAGLPEPPPRPDSLIVRDRSGERSIYKDFFTARGDLKAAASSAAEVAVIDRMFTVLDNLRRGESEALLLSQRDKEV